MSCFKRTAKMFKYPKSVLTTSRMQDRGGRARTTLILTTQSLTNIGQRLMVNLAGHQQFAWSPRSCSSCSMVNGPGDKIPLEPRLAHHLMQQLTIERANMARVADLRSGHRSGVSDKRTYVLPRPQDWRVNSAKYLFGDPWARLVLVWWQGSRCGQGILCPHIWSKPHPAIAQAAYFSSARDAKVIKTECPGIAHISCFEDQVWKQLLCFVLLSANH